MRAQRAEEEHGIILLMYDKCAKIWDMRNKRAKSWATGKRAKFQMKFLSEISAGSHSKLSARPTEFEGIIGHMPHPAVGLPFHRAEPLL